VVLTAGRTACAPGRGQAQSHQPRNTRVAQIDHTDAISHPSRRYRPKGSRRNKVGRLRRVGGSHRVVPLWVEAMAGDREGVDVFAGVFDAGGVLASVKDTVDG
jgi:hypothetical protein